MALSRMEKLEECLAIAERHNNTYMAENIREEIKVEQKRMALEASFEQEEG